jgi:hypothetical protein
MAMRRRGQFLLGTSCLRNLKAEVKLDLKKKYKLDLFNVLTEVTLHDHTVFLSNKIL